jgi:hypothetical protein
MNDDSGDKAVDSMGAKPSNGGRRPPIERNIWNATSPIEDAMDECMIPGRSQLLD